MVSAGITASSLCIHALHLVRTSERSSQRRQARWGTIDDDAQMSADFDSYDFLPSYPSDYCDYCNCTTDNDNTWMMKDLVLMDSAPDAAKVSTAASEGASAAAKDFTGTNNQVQVRIYNSTKEKYMAGLRTNV